MKKNLTSEQIQKRDQRRETFKTLVKEIGAMSDDKRAEMSKQIGIITTCDGRALSPFNTLLLASQRAGLTMVGGFRQWLGHGRAVMKGEHGLMIWIPASKKSADGTPGETFFIPGTVFDISQTSAISGAEPAVECAVELRGAVVREAAKVATGAIAQFEAYKQQYPGVLLMFRIGDFYEMFQDDARIASRQLGLALATRQTPTGDIAMVGIPYHAVDAYLRHLVGLDLRVAICEKAGEVLEQAAAA